MKLIERYVFRRIVSALVLTFLALSVMVWLTQALREFDLVTSSGQDLWVFLKITAMLVPVLVTIVLPVALLIAVVFTFTILNGDSELAAINASGAPQIALLRPVLAAGLIVGILVASMTLYFAPLALRTWQTLIADVHSGIVTRIVNEGQFMALAPKLTFHLRSRDTDGSFSGIFVFDDRESDKSVTYLAEKGAVLDNPLGVFLIMTDGGIQQRDKLDGSMSMIEFSSYAFDLSAFARSGAVPTLPPSARRTAYLLDPDPDDPYFRQFPGRFRAELHERISGPFYALVFALVPLLFLGQAGSTRESRTASVTMAVLVVFAVRTAGFLLPGQFGVVTLGLMYVLPIGTAALAIALILLGRQVRPPERIVAFSESVFGRVSGLLTRPRAAPG